MSTPEPVPSESPAVEPAPSPPPPPLTLEERIDKLEVALASLGAATLSGAEHTGKHFLAWLKEHLHKLF